MGNGWTGSGTMTMPGTGSNNILQSKSSSSIHNSFAKSLCWPFSYRFQLIDESLVFQFPFSIVK